MTNLDDQTLEKVQLNHEKHKKFLNNVIKTDKKIIMIMIAVGLVSTAAGGYLTANSWRAKPKKLDMNYDTEIIIEDDYDRLEDTSVMYEAMKNFQNTTGITPAFVVIDEDDITGTLEKYASEKYNEMFDDENHWLTVYEISHMSYFDYDEDGNYTVKNDYWSYKQGSNTDSMMDAYALEYFNPCTTSVDSYTTSDGEYHMEFGTVKVSETYSDELNEMSKRTMYSGITNEYAWYPFAGTLASIICILIFTIDLKKKKQQLINDMKYDIME